MICKSNPFYWQHSLLKITNDLLASYISVLVLLDLSAYSKPYFTTGIRTRCRHWRYCEQWFESCLFNRPQFVHIYKESSLHSKVTYGIPQGSELGPIVFTEYILHLGSITRRLSIYFHCYAEDIQLYPSMKPDVTPIS